MSYAGFKHDLLEAGSMAIPAARGQIRWTAGLELTLSDLGDFGDFVGGIAVIVTLIYLARQIRENTKVTRLQMVQAIKSDAMHLRIAGIQNPDVAVILMKSSEDEAALTTEERIRFNLLCAAIFENFDQSYQARVAGLVDSQPGNEHLMRSYLSQGAVRQWWYEGRNLFHPDFVAHVEQDVLPELELRPAHWQAGHQVDV